MARMPSPLNFNMAAYFPNSIWDGDSGNRDSDAGALKAPDHRDWGQLIQEMWSVQDYILNQNILLNERYIYFGTTPEASLHYESSILELNLAESGTNDFRIGDGTNYVQISSTGVMTLAGTAKRRMTVQLDVDAIDQLAHSKPTQVEVGVFKTYSFPVYSTDNEELFFEFRMPYRWDGETDVLICIDFALSDAEDAGDVFKFQLSWEHVPHDGVISASVHDVETQTAVVTGRTAQYSTYHAHFTLDYDVDGAGNELEADDIIGFRLRRIASSGTAVDNEILFLNAVADFQIDKIFDTWVRA